MAGAVMALCNALSGAFTGMEEAAGFAEFFIDVGSAGFRLDKGRDHLVVGATRCVHKVAGFKDAALRRFMDRLPIVTIPTDGVEVARRGSIGRRRSDERPFIIPVPDIILGTSQLPVFLASFGDEHGEASSLTGFVFIAGGANAVEFPSGRAP